ncbi:FMN-dependent NADH-azoreductase [Psychrobium sp. 1_MG-2023]|uniref:FMN-dependent NADH-azoreductase n=1 Tax=Psychrobium sp. 1_MG-2023 TaxID=3062624 RepID=UPI000C322B4E|nr:NAD(P)H-dependent oxidoreductase [Psychrobium sp. 1_MG-2023]MDP2562810.1 NAD(P)H-dependent oxidoreductase [Psychrobium sp. 1_MG-2023]PKF54441.1 ACP phosphodiesterase [Alteromonadales bacterium alter-6D02]
MTTILHIDASAREKGDTTTKHKSISKSLAAHFTNRWLATNNQDKVIYRDIGANPPAFISQDWIAAVFTPDEQQTTQQKSLLSLSNTLISEVERADLIVMSTPMYNYGMPAVLKAWFDQVIRINKTISFDLARGDFPLAPIMSGKTLVLITSSGEFGFEIGGVREHMNHLGPHVKTASKYLGVESFHEIKSEYQEFGDDRHQQSVTNAYRDIDILVSTLSETQS